MRTKPFLLALSVMAGLTLTVGLLLVGCGGSTTTTTQATTSTTVAVTTTSTSSSIGPGSGAPARILVPLTGAEVVPAVQSSAGGTLTLLLEAGPSGTFNISYELEVKDVVDATAAHIHLGPKGTEGPIVVPLFTGPAKTGSFSGLLAQGTITEKDLTGPMQGKTFQELAGAVLAGQTYVNVHTVKNPNGEIRGQIIVDAAGAGTTVPTAGGSETSTTSAIGY